VLGGPEYARAGARHPILRRAVRLADHAGRDDPSGYLHIKNGEEFIGGIPPATHRNPQMPAHWLAYFLVNDCFASAERAKSLGANFHVPPMVMEKVGTMAVLADPQGATFAIFEPPADRKHL